MQTLRAADNRRWLVQADGTPFFWLGDTAWELFHRLDREEAITYLDSRSALGFTVVQAVALAEFDGLRVPNAYGHLPLLPDGQGGYDPRRPDPSGYWEHVDFIVTEAARRGLYIGLLPTWGDKYNQKWGQGPEVFNPDNAFDYGQWLGARYERHPNIVWVLGGDRPLETEQHRLVVRRMAEGLKQGDGGNHLLTFHPVGGTSSSRWVHDEAWLDFHMLQSGHGLERRSYRMVEADYGLTPVRPTLDGEPCYEDHPVNFKPENGFYQAREVRRALYWAVFAGGLGVTYGHHCIWSMTTEPSEYFPMTWRDALNRPAATQVRHLRELLESMPFMTAAPDQELVRNPGEDLEYAAALSGEGFALLYLPTNRPVEIPSHRLSQYRSAQWFDPKTGTRQDMDHQALQAGDDQSDKPVALHPPLAEGPDWVLILQ